MLQKHEIESIKASPDCIRRFLASYDLMLNFYGCKVVDTATGTLGRITDWKSRYRNLETHSHNFLRITRILKCLGELGFEHYKRPFLEHFVEEIFINKELRSPGDSCRNYWVETLRNDAEREALSKKINELAPLPEVRHHGGGGGGGGAGRWQRADDSDEESPKSYVTPKKSEDELESERRRFRDMIAHQNQKDKIDDAGSDDDDDDDDDDEGETGDMPEKYMKWIQAELSDDDDSDEVSEEEGAAGAGAPTPMDVVSPTNAGSGVQETKPPTDAASVEQAKPSTTEAPKPAE